MTFLIVSMAGALSIAIAFFVESKKIKAALSVISFIGFAFLAILAILVNQFSFRGNSLLIALSFLLMFCGLAIGAWKLFSKKKRAWLCPSFAIAALASLIFAFAPEAYKRSIPEAKADEVSLMDYTPFGYLGETKAKSLKEESTLKLSGDLPKLDGATALYPLYSAFARAAYPENSHCYPYFPLNSENEAESTDVACSTTDGAFDALITGGADIIFLMDVSEAQRARADALGVSLIMEPIGKEAFVFFVNRHNPISGLTLDSVRKIYSGEAKTWKDAGGKAADEIIAYQREPGSGSQTALEKLMGGAKLERAPMSEVYSSMMGMYQEVAKYKNYRNALGYSFLFYIQEMVGGNQVKLLAIDGKSPTKENIINGQYPLSSPFYLIKAKLGDHYLNPGRAGNIDSFTEWIHSSQGQWLVNETGYISLQKPL